MSIFEAAQFLVLASVIVWILPPIRHYKSYMFDFFLILALVDPITLIYGMITSKSLPMWIIALFVYLLIISVISEEYLKKMKYLFIALPILLISLIPFLQTTHYHFAIMFEMSVLLFIFLKWLITNYVDNKKLKIFYLMLVFYILTVILKYFNLLIGFADASQFFVITSITQILFGLYFSVAREDGSGIAH
ncbi:MAG: hypothetical protein FD143_505 [Ignavibacteria bacterium]|nr:MAG: hypothetical protein FD143_505 [Ignavibacteria bacterium]KAF0161576.1 MAG: hypothetical protein FD188_693 [Ignavibacteria bacterium]